VLLCDPRQNARTQRVRSETVLSSLSTSLILRGVLAVIVGVIAIAWPGVTVLALVILFAIYAFIDAGLETSRAFGSAGAGSVLGHLLLALVGVAAGVVALIWPGITALALTLVVAVWAYLAGFLQIWAAFQDREKAGTRAMFIVGGLLAIAFGVVLSSRPDIGAVTLALLYGLFSLTIGVSQIVMGIEARRGSSTLDALAATAA
jgi:uncharacterized membrane protein HdeD (DUF308 family)